MTKTPDVSNQNYLNDVLHRFDCYFTNDFSNVEKISQVYCVPYNDKNEILLISQNRSEWYLPGGTVEDGEDLLQTMFREIEEEASITVDQRKLTPLFYQEVYKMVDSKWIFVTNQARYAAPIKKKGEFISDPGGNVRFNKFFPVKELHKTLAWGEVSEWLERRMIELLDRRSG